ncbi:MAG: hypothetical protein J0H42_30240 [Rhizobiales bacterium]|nr:hypothetical protein [Hyphomicrobiales bacterium]
MALLEYCGAARRHLQKYIHQNPVKKIFFAIYFVLTKSGSIRFSRATDVLPFCGLTHLSRPVRLERPNQNNNRRSRNDHIKAA